MPRELTEQEKTTRTVLMRHRGASISILLGGWRLIAEAEIGDGRVEVREHVCSDLRLVIAETLGQKKFAEIVPKDEWPRIGFEIEQMVQLVGASNRLIRMCLDRLPVSVIG